MTQQKCSSCQTKRIKVIIEKLKVLNASDIKNPTIPKGTTYIKTFLIDDTRNNKGWRVTWDSIKKYTKTFLEKPGIEYIKCTVHGCNLDHTGEETDSYNDSLHKQEQYRIATIVDYTFYEDKHTAYAFLRIDKNEFAEKIHNRAIKYVSPAIHADEEKSTLIQPPPGDKNEWYIDTTGWKAGHLAFVDMPAYGYKARILDICISEDGTGKDALEKLKSNNIT